MATEAQGNHGSGILIGDGNALVRVAVAAAMGLPLGKCHGNTCQPRKQLHQHGSRIQGRALAVTKVLTCTMFREWSSDYAENSVMLHFLAPTTVAMATA